MIRHFVTDRRRFALTVDRLAACAGAAARGGVDVIQIREPDLPDREMAGLVRAVVAATAATAARVLVNDRVDVAIVAGAAGVHLRADSPPASRVRAIVPKGFVIGRSVHTRAEVDAAIADGGADYLLFGTVFPSAGKPQGHPVAGLDALREVCAATTLPVIAIGGMTEARAAAAVGAGAAGVAAVEFFHHGAD